MSQGDNTVVGILRELYRLRYREPCLLPGHEVLGLYRQALEMESVRNFQRMTIRLMRIVDTGFEV
jgi:hypothetical protein